jgi:hypothetical protein
MDQVLSPSQLLAIDHCRAEQSYYKCCLLVHPDIGRLAQVTAQLMKHYGWPRVSLGAAVSTVLLPLAPGDRLQAAPNLVRRLLQEQGQGPVLCTEIDILFEPSLALDPLRILQNISRVVSLVVLWPGTFVDNVLSYAGAQPGHAHYRRWPHPELGAAGIITL